MYAVMEEVYKYLKILQMAINLKNQIIILDEAHNIEDICRDVASVAIRNDHLEEMIKDCHRLSEVKPKNGEEDNRNMYLEIESYLLRLKNFVNDEELKNFVSILQESL